MKRSSLFFTVLSLTLALGIISFLRAGATQNHISKSFVRFHVIANSDLPRDQEVKLKVRDAVVKQAEAITRAAKNSAEAQLELEKRLPELERTANAVLNREGVLYSATATLNHRYFPTKAYAGLRLPAGDYDAVSITLGEGNGRNFWCVLFPPLCVTPASVTTTETGLSEEELALLTETGTITRYRFLLMELFGKLEHKMD